MTAEATLARFREYMVGPARFMNLLSCFELGIVDHLRAKPGSTAEELGAAVGAKAAAVEQMLFLLVKEGFVARDGTTGGYALDALAEVDELDLRRPLEFMDKIKVTTLRQLFYLTESVREGKPVGLRELYGFDGDLYEAMTVHADLRASWGRLMDSVTARIDPWFFDNVDIPAGSRVLDLAGNTGLGAIHTVKMKPSPGLRVTTFDLPGREEACLRNFREQGVADQCSFIGGDVFVSVPTGFDVVLIKHFLNMFDKDEVFAILDGVRDALEPGGQVHVLVPIYSEDIKDSCTVDYYPSFFLGCATGRGGPQKLSTFRSWMRERGFTITNTLAQHPAELPPDALPLQGILSATKTA
ncbi:methyltransferase [Actinokineospora terrae]|uniref:O-methyltransferase n=1 Tax=Actinokineospora terrae TaxID=155974 RepID=A0A1H9ML64_9PSEU|nr:methyltransferase [Actinokineospora terrae]SER24450.1 O-methyltransferase [Actinokineospora terrae]